MFELVYAGRWKPLPKLGFRTLKTRKLTMAEGKKITRALGFFLSLGLNYAVDQGKLCGSRIDEPGTLVKKPASHFLEGTSECGTHSALNIMFS